MNFNFMFYVFFKNWQSIKYTDSKTHWLIQPFLLKNDENKKRVPIIIPASVTNSAHPNNKKLKSTAVQKPDLMICHVSGKNS